MRPLRLAAFVAFLLAILALVVSPAYGTSCVPLVEWNGVTYSGGMNLARAPMLGRSIGIGAVPPCGESGCGGPDGRKVTIVEVADVPPEVAIASADVPQTVYVAPGYLAILPGEPLHDIVFGDRPGAPNQRRGFRCDELFRLDGVVAVTPVWGTNFRVRVTRASGSARERVGRTLNVFIDSRTEIMALRRNGIPYLEEGERVSVEGALCRGSGEAFLFAGDRLSPGRFS